jgi:hypothetical protein
MTLWKRQSILILSAILSIYLVGNVILSLIQLDFAFDTFITPEFASSYSRNDLQVLTPFLFFGTCCLIVMIIEILKNPIFPLSVLSLFSLGLSIVFLCLHLTGSDITEDFSDLRESKQAIASIPPNKVILTDTFHYPSRPSPRPYFGYLSSLSNEQFYFSMPANYQSSSSWKEKYTNSLLFFGSRISESHMSFLEKSGVSVILHSKLCKSPLIDSLKSYIKPTYENANFLILQIEPDQHQGLRMKLPLVSTFIDPDSYLQNNLCKPPPDWKMPLSSGQFVFQNR